MATSATTQDITFDEYTDLFFEIADDDSLSEEQQIDKMEKVLTDRGISEERQKELLGQLLQGFNNPQPQQQSEQ